MPGNSFGQQFRITTYGESHGHSIGVIIDGCPAGLAIDLSDVQKDLARRRPGQSAIVTQRNEPDHVEIVSGVFEGVSTGTPISMIIKNKDQKSKDYSHIADRFRPSHADYTYQQKYGVRDYRGGGRSSARETAARVAAGAVAKALLRTQGMEVWAYVSQVGDLALGQPYNEVDLAEIEQNIVRCPNAKMAEQMVDYIKDVRKEGDTVGGIVCGLVKGSPVGLGEPAFDKLHADLGKAMLSINACKGFEYGSGFAGVTMRGSTHNDQFVKEGEKISTTTNYSGGVQGGISNGMDIYFRVAFKPVATIMRDQASLNEAGEEVSIQGKGRHDPCVVPRAVPIVEAMTALVMADHLLRARGAKI